MDNAYSDDTKNVWGYHFTPTHASWLNLVERWFAEITTKRIRLGSWSSFKGLQRAIMDHIHHWNESGKRLV